MKSTILLRFLIILSIFNRLRPIFGDVFDECANNDDESFVASKSDCSAYIYCDGENSLLGYCDDGQYFDGESCDDKANVYCPLDDESESQEDAGVDTTIETTVNIKTTTPLPTTSTIRQSTTPPSTTPPTTTTPAATTTRSTSIESTSSTISFDALTIAPIVKDTCPISDDPNQIILISNSESCTDYYLCYHGHAIEMHCTDHLHFNADTGKCDFPENVHCLNDRPYANKCLPHVTDFFPHPEKCNYFYYCIKGFMTVQQCPFYYGWDIEKRSCVHISQAKCFNGAKKALRT